MGWHRKVKVSEWLDVSLEQSIDRICDCEGAIIQNFSYRGRGPPFLYFIIKDVDLVVMLPTFSFPCIFFPFVPFLALTGPDPCLSHDDLNIVIVLTKLL